ncbi:LacI family DNA-binding transcriptional regulator [Allorhizocola rhizosphaerae]|uniref:LacI family DNA-binding transcriptional regulator n=1 Tax=Allorhizocola rhizosphaerae TaxID=1872709 RepID=UPI000E3DC1A4|nr:substrate-binding domain-containing protein [Allorhizocola rhizosphaerae]
MTTGLVELILDASAVPWTTEVIGGIHAAGLSAIVSRADRRPQSLRRQLRSIGRRPADGVIIVNARHQPLAHIDLWRLTLPAVVVDLAGARSSGFPTIGTANWSGALHATDHLIRLGHKRIGFIGGPAQLLCDQERHNGYRAALEAAGLAFDDGLVRRDGDADHPTGLAEGMRLLGLPLPPTAIITTSDHAAFGVYEAIRRRGLRVADDVSVVGFDDLPAALRASPPLTTTRQPVRDMAVLAARTLMRKEHVGASRVEVATELRIRHSTGPPAFG